ncbi:inovirus-type Gp2 protein [Bordetella hinzii]|uniref:YagK/YfjJ domain-containing protein n=1 Tax=Bordetella hinzii TaxID=103855 RepID=UPI0039FBDEDA
MSQVHSNNIQPSKFSIEQALAYGQTLRWHKEQGIEEYPNPACYLAMDVTEIVKVMERVTRTKNPLFTFQVSARTGQAFPKPTQLGRQFCSLFKLEISQIQKEFAHCQFHPLFDLFVRHMEGMGPIAVLLASPNTTDILNRLVENIRREATAQAFQQRRDRIKANIRHNLRSLNKYVHDLMRRWARLLVIRLDTGYRKGVPLQGPRPDATAMIQQARQHREEFLRCLRRRYPALLGYAWKFEHGITKGPHYHWLLFFDASQVRADITLGDELGQLWKGPITGWIGTYFNCNREHYHRRGIGTIHYSDAQSIMALKDYVLPYLVKPEYYLRPKGRARTYDRGQLPKQAPKKRGRPRLLKWP